MTYCERLDKIEMFGFDPHSLCFCEKNGECTAIRLLLERLKYLKECKTKALKF